MKIPTEVREALDRTGLPWEVTNGSKHKQIRVNGQLVGILPKGSGSVGFRAVKNCLAQIRRAATKETV